MRVLLVVAHGGTGGMQVQVGMLARGLYDAGCEVTVAAGPGPLECGAADVVALPALSATSAAGFTRSLRGVVRAATPDVVHAHGLRLAPILATAASRRSLVTCHGVDPTRARRTAALVRATRVNVASCGEGPKRLLAAGGLHSRVLDNAVPDMPAPVPREALAARFGLDATAVLAVCPARLTTQKDPVTLVRALAEAPGVAGLLVGGGPLEPNVRAELDRLGIADRVVVAPWADDARALLASADLLALSSVWEGQPTVVLEAMASRVAVVATACPGTADTVVDEATGLLAPVRDPAALGAAIARAARDAPLRATLAEAAFGQVADHRIDVVVAAHLAAYRRVLDGAWR